MSEQKESKPLNFKALKREVSGAVEPVVEAVSQYQPYVGKSKYKPDLNELPQTMATFFRSTADAIEGRRKLASGDVDEALNEVKLDKKARDLAAQGSKFFGDQVDNVKGSLDDAKLDKKAGDLVKNAKDTIKDAKLDKKANELVKSAKDTLKDAKLDKKAGDAADSAGTALAGIAAPVIAAVADFAGKAGDTVKDAKLDKHLSNATDALGDKVKEVKFDKKASDVAGTAGDIVSNVGDAVSHFLKDTHLDKKAADAAGTASDMASNVGNAVSDFLKDAHLDKKAADVAGTASDIASNVGVAVTGFVKDNKLDKKAAGAVSSAGDVASNVSDAVGGFLKDAKLDKKVADATDTVSARVKEMKLDKKLADAKLPEKAFAAANIIPGVEIKNPKKAAKQFRKRRAAALKAVALQQKELNKKVKQGSKTAGKYLEARQKDIQSGKIRIPGYEPPKQDKGFPWGKTVLAGGAVYGGLAANNIRLWSNVPPLQSKLDGEGHYYRSRQGVIFYKEAGQASDDKPPVVFVHGIGAGNHSYEWEQNFGAIAGQYHTFAYDLLGFGNSERPALKYTAEVYIKQLTEFLDGIVKRPAIIIASSLTSSYAVQVAFRRPQLIEKLVLMEPTGIYLRRGNFGPNLAGPLAPAAFAVLRSPVFGKAIYSGVSSHSGIKSFMESQMFYDKSQATPERIEQYWTAAHQDGAEFAPPSFFTGLLNAEIGETLGKIEQPVLIIWGKESMIPPENERKELSVRNKTAQVETIERARLAVNQERPEQFNKLVLDFLGRPTEGKTEASNTGVGFVQNDSLLESVSDGTSVSGQTPISEQLPPVSQEQLDYAAVEWSHQRGERGGQSASDALEAVDAAAQPQQGVEYDTEGLKQELEDHRKTFIGDAETGAALVQDADGDGVDDRRM